MRGTGKRLQEIPLESPATKVFHMRTVMRKIRLSPKATYMDLLISEARSPEVKEMEQMRTISPRNEKGWVPRDCSVFKT